MTGLLPENGDVRNETLPETQSTSKNQAESEIIQSALFQQARSVDGAAGRRKR
jgi:hypothetical protein